MDIKHDKETCKCHTYTPKKRDHWTLTLPGVDAFLVSSATLPAIERRENGEIERHLMSVSLYEIAKTSSYNIMREWLEAGDNRDVKLKFLDEVGNVTESWDLVASPFKVEISPLSYENTCCVQTLVSFFVESFVIINH